MGTRSQIKKNNTKLIPYTIITNSLSRTISRKNPSVNSISSSNMNQMTDTTLLAKARKTRFDDLPNFSGHSSEDVERFLKSIKNITKANDQSENHEILEIVRGKLIQSAGLWFDNHEQDFKRWSDFELAFRNRYFSSTMIHKKFDLLKQRKQLHDEPVTSYFDDVVNLYYVSIEKYMFDRVKRERDKIKENHKRKLEKLNKGPIGQNYETTRNKLVHNISTYVLTPAEERLLCRGWNFCIESKITKTDDFKTDMEINATKLESHCHPSVFSTIYHHLHDYANKYIRNINKNNIRNISDEEFHAIKTLRNNKEIIISRADKGNAIVVMDKKDYIEKTNNILQLKQFQHTTKSLQKEKEEEMNKYLRELYKENTITKELFYSIRSTCSSIACMYGQPKIHKNGYPLRPIISSIGSYNYELSKYLAGLIKANR
ncbi:unnamed protein product, partial [Rotaria magnacalcarata]